jgi:hypothetical protein
MTTTRPGNLLCHLRIPRLPFYRGASSPVPAFPLAARCECLTVGWSVSEAAVQAARPGAEILSAKTPAGHLRFDLRNRQRWAAIEESRRNLSQSKEKEKKERAPRKKGEEGTARRGL